MADVGGSGFGVVLKWERRLMLTPSVLAWPQLEGAQLGSAEPRNVERGYLGLRSSLICPECGCSGGSGPGYESHFSK